MSMLRRLREYLEGEKVPYTVLPHEETYTAPELAEALHVSGKEFARPRSCGGHRKARDVRRRKPGQVP